MSGKLFVDELAEMTAAVVYASNDPVGSGAAGDFNWEYNSKGVGASDELLSVDKLEGIPGLLLPDKTPPKFANAKLGGNGTASSFAVDQGKVLAFAGTASDDGKYAWSWSGRGPTA